MTDNLFYEVLQITGRETRLTARFRTLADAQRYVKTHETAGRWDIVTPEGHRTGTPSVAPDARAARQAALMADTLPSVPRGNQGAA